MPKSTCYKKQGEILVKNLKSRHFDAYYCIDRHQALGKALSFIPDNAVVGWGGSMSAEQIGLIDAVRRGSYRVIDRDACVTAQERDRAMHQCLSADVFICGSNAISMDGQLVNIDGNGNRVGAIVYGPESVIMIVGMNKVAQTLDGAINRARNVAAPMNQQRFLKDTPCTHTGVCADCISPDCICNQLLITRHCRPVGRIKVILVGEDLGL